ncbi:MAG: oligosaccharide flippase family protein [Candidatus Bathyarchaeota archaeon]
MSDAAKLAKISTKGGFNLFWGVALSSVISAVGIMIVAGILEEGEYGLVTIAITAPTLISLIRDLGVDQATIKYTAQYNHQNQPEKIKNLLTAGILFEIFMGLLLSLFSYLISGFIASQIFDRPEIVLLIQIASFIIIGDALFKISNSAFIGYEKMQYHALILIAQSLFKTILMIVLVLSDFGVLGAVVGQTVAYIMVGIFGITLLFFNIFRKLEINTIKHEIISNLKRMFSYGLPLSGAAILFGFMTQFYTFLIAIYLSDQIVGNYTLAINFAVLVGFFVQPVSIIMFPAFSKIDGQKDPKTLQNVFRFSVKYASLLIVPAAFMVMALSQPAVATLFPGKYEFTPLFLSLYLIQYLFTAFGTLISDNLIKGQGRTDLNLKLTLLNTLLGIILGLTLIPLYGVIGLIASILFSAIPSAIISLWWIKKHYEATINYQSSIKILLASSVSAIFTYAIVLFVPVSSWIILILGASIFFVTYLVAAPLIGAINKDDTENLKEMLRALGPLARILNIHLNLIEKLTEIFQK